MRAKRNILALKILYAYSCLNVFCKFYFHRYCNLWIVYIEW